LTASGFLLQRVDICGRNSQMRGNRWDDHYARRARKEHRLARSVYKLEEMDRKFRLIRPALRVLDLGCYPGSWSQYALMRVGPKGYVLGVDQMRPDRLEAPNFAFFQADILHWDPSQLTDRWGPVDVVLSDLAPKTTGNRSTDAARSMQLCRKALEVAISALRKGGDFLCKIFEGEESVAFRQEAGLLFRRTRLFKPAAVRKGSREIYLIGWGKRSA